MQKLKLFVVAMLTMAIAIVGVKAEVLDSCDDSRAVAKVGDRCYEKLSEAFTNATEGETVILNADVKISEAETDGYINLKTDANLTFDLNGHKITSDKDNYSIFYVNNGKNLIITDTSNSKNGTIEHTGKGGAVKVQTGTLTLTSGNYVADNEESTVGTIELGGTQSLTNDDYRATLIVKDGVNITGGGITTMQKGSKLVFEGGTIIANDFAISGNGTDTKDSIIEIKGGTIKSKTNAAIYHPQTGSLTITGGNIEGLIGIVARQGSISIKGGNITATGTGEDLRVGDAKKGSDYVKLPQGIAVIVDNTEDSYADNAKVEISDGDFKTTKKAVLSYGEEATKGEIVVTGGTFNQDVEKIYLASEDLGQSESGVVGVIHKVEVKESANGKAEVKYNNAAEGEEVIVNITADKDYEIDEIKILDKDNKEIKFIKNENNIEFTMPTSDVTISVTFKKIITDEPTSTNPNEENPQTGDNILMYLSLGVASVAVAIISIKKFRKN